MTGTIWFPEGRGQFNFTRILDLPSDQINNLRKLLSNMEQSIEYKKQKLAFEQTELPEFEKDDTEMEVLEKKRQNILSRMRRPVNGKIFKEEVVVWFGKYIQYAHIDTIHGVTVIQELSLLDVDFADETEIMKVIRTLSHSAV